MLDFNYSFVFGSVYLNDLVKKFGGFYIMIVVVYNVGGSWVWDWVCIYGDFCSFWVDMFDWIENVLFSEMWNYI